ncbi:MAG: MFS transporter [Actinomycetota bacterium]|nr:MFS transporter [Actinomycetota bacterium]
MGTMGDEGPIRADHRGEPTTPDHKDPRHRIEEGERPGGALSGRLKIVQPLKLRDFSLLWAGMTVSMLGDGIYFVAIAWQVLRLSDAPTALSAVGVAWTIPQVVFLLVGGVVSDRLERRTILLASDVVRGVAIGALGLLSVSGNIELWHILVLVAVYGGGEAFFMPAFGAIVPDIVPQNLLVEANALDQFVRPVAFRLVGPAVGGLLVALWGPGEAFLIDSVSFGLSAACLLLMRPQRRAAATPHASVLSEIGEGFAFVRSQTWLWGTLAAAAVAQLCFVGPLQVLLPLLVRENIGGGAGAYGFILAIGGVGSILASITVSQKGLPRRQVTFMYLNWSVGTFVISYYAIATEIWEAMLASLVVGATFTTGLIVWGTLMHRMVPPELLGRVSSFDWLVSTGLTPLSFALAGPVALVLGNEATLALAGVVGGLAVLAFLWLPGLRAMEAAGAHLATGNVNGGSDAPR